MISSVEHLLPDGITLLPAALLVSCGEGVATFIADTPATSILEEMQVSNVFTKAWCMVSYRSRWSMLRFRNTA